MVQGSGTPFATPTKVKVSTTTPTKKNDGHDDDSVRFIIINGEKIILKDKAEAPASFAEQLCLYRKEDRDKLDHDKLIAQFEAAIAKQRGIMFKNLTMTFDSDNKLVDYWQEKVKAAASRKQAGNDKLMACSAKYAILMRAIR